MTTITLRKGRDARTVGPGGDTGAVRRRKLYAFEEDVDLGILTPRARALAEAHRAILPTTRMTLAQGGPGPGFYAHSAPNFRSASSCSGVSLWRLVLALVSHTPSFTVTGSVSSSAVISTTIQPYRFAGACADPTGLYKMGARYYDHNLGRFTQPDPSGQDTNPYLYANGDPINNTDPTGLFSLSGALDVAGIGLAIGAVAASGPLGIGLGLAAAGTDIAGAVVSGAFGSEIAGVAVVSTFTMGVAGGAKALAKGSAVAGRTATGVDAGYAALGYGANKAIND
ncbi:RHS repeat-associated core domain-containing protein [Streptomyces sp. NPDC006645]|uniref:RHS repeat-associated core domain-containing protein n=1 Tax=unclassified Streptomyces TaxID=2593676 RepID=UPI0033B35769